MTKFCSMLTQLAELGIEVIIRKTNGRLCGYFLNGFYRSDGDACFFLHGSVIVLHTRFDGERQIDDVWDFVRASHASWKLSRGTPKWMAQSPSWVPLYKKLGLLSDQENQS